MIGTVRLPHNYRAILEDADSSVYTSSSQNIYAQLLKGVYLNQKGKKYWIDKKTSSNCFMLFPRELNIAWAEEERCWRWIFLNENARDTSIEAVEMKGISWLEVTGTFPTANLTAGKLYEVVFVIKLLDPAFGWRVPVNFKLVLPNGEEQEQEEVLMTKLRNRWLEIPAGERRGDSVLNV